jgi:two-component system, LytTR family, response regulator
MITCIIIEDQEKMRGVLIDYVNKTPSLTLKADFADPVEALGFLDSNEIGLIFLDIHLPQLTGLEFIETLRARLGQRMPLIILTTAYEQYALSGFEHGVTDYLLKPIGYKRFRIAVDKVTETLKRSKPSASSPEEEFFLVEVNGKRLKINLKEIVYVESAGNYQIINVLNDSHIVLKSMASLEELLPTSMFLRVHRGYIVALTSIHSLAGNVLKITYRNEQKEIPIGLTYKEEMMKRLPVI